MGDMGFFGQDEWSGPGGSAFPDTLFKKKNHWKFLVRDVIGDGVNSLPPSRGSRPGLTFKTMQAEHLNETIFFPSKPDWKPITLTLYDIVKTGENPVFTWIRRAYDPFTCSLWKPCLEPTSTGPIQGSLKAAECFLNLYDGCGNVIEQWVFEHCWPESVEFPEGDMASSEIIVCDVTLRYDRAYINVPETDMVASFITILPDYECSSVPISNIPLSMVMLAEEPEFVAVRSPDFIKII